MARSKVDTPQWIKDLGTNPRTQELGLLDSAWIELGEQLVDARDEIDAFVDDDAVRWIEANFRIPETKDHRIVLGEYQKAVLRRALTRIDGKFPYSLILWSDIKKSIKSCVAAAVALWMAFNTPWGSIKIVANDLKQADSRVSFYIRRCIELNPAMQEVCRSKPSGYLILFANHARIESIPVDPSGEAGGNDDMVVFSELWAAQNDAAKRLWTELTLSPTKYGQSFRWVETYAGYSGESPLLEQLYETGIKFGSLIEDISQKFTPPLPIYENMSARILAMWNTEPRMPWQTQDYYSQEEGVLSPTDFRRVHKNQWVSSVDSFVPIEWWDSCLDNTIPVLHKNDPVILAMDAAVSGDTFGLLAVSGSKGGEDYYVRYARRWIPPKWGKLDFTGPEEEVHRLIDLYNVVEVAYDPYQLEDMAARLKREMICMTYTFNQMKERLVADKALFDRIRDRKVHHSGEPELREHILNSNRQAEDGKLRIVKRSDLMKIDLAICLSMGVSRAAYWRL